MIYSDKIKKAVKIAFEAHKNDVDKGGYPYIMHPLTIAEKFKEENLVIVALMHDIVEDHGDVYSFDSLQNCVGFGDEVLDALKAITIREGENYSDYIERVSKNRIATLVKIEDLRHNSDVTRVEFVDPLGVDNRTKKRLKKYNEAYATLNKAVIDNSWRIYNLI